MKKLFAAAFFAFFCLSAWCADYNIKTDPVLKAMRLQNAAAVKALKKAKTPVYFLSYQLTDSYELFISSVLGGAQHGEDRRRLFDVEARAGSRKMDNTRKIKELSFDSFYRQASASAPIEDDIPALRRVFWLQTEEAVKKAQEMYHKVKTNNQTASQRGDDSDDFSAPLPPAKHYETAEIPQIDIAALKEMLSGYSLLFRGYDFILTSFAALNINIDNIYYINSEGAELKTPRVLMRMSFRITSRHKDGMQLERNVSYDFTDLKNIPAPDKVRADIQKMIGELKALKDAPAAEPYHGPVLLRNKATGVFFHEILGHRVEGHRQKDDDFGQTFTQKLNQLVIAPLISVRDNPNVKEFKGIPLRGHYLYDDEGVRAQDAVIIKDGVLKGFLMGRNPIKGFPQSNGHGRKESGNNTVSRMGVTIVEANETVPYAVLRGMLVDEARKQGKPYGLLIDDISGGFTNTGTGGPQSFKVKPLLVYKVYADGRPDEIIRGADIVGTPLASFNKIVAAADDSDVFNGSCGAESGWVPVSAVAPSILVSEMEIEKVDKTYDSLPLLPAPAAPAKTAKGGK
ncbi:MAG: peptidase U62, partial [Elusimicrobiota bacterium]|nr:peptidase U62 [Elusimicrobiota bacterium]